MKVLLYLANAFIDAFGITHPSEKGRGKAARYIASLLLLMLLLICLAFAFGVYTVRK